MTDHATAEPEVLDAEVVDEPVDRGRARAEVVPLGQGVAAGQELVIGGVPLLGADGAQMTREAVLAQVQAASAVNTIQEHIRLKNDPEALYLRVLDLVRPDEFFKPKRSQNKPEDWYLTPNTWKAIATRLDIEVKDIGMEVVQRDEQNRPIIIKVTATASWLTGESQTAEGSINALDDSSFAKDGKAAFYATANWEHNLRQKAAARAMGAAVRNLLGIHKLTFDEVNRHHQAKRNGAAAPAASGAPANGQPAADVKPHGPEASETLAATVRKALGVALDGDQERVDATIAAVTEKYSYMPAAAAGALVLLAKQLREQREAVVATTF